MPTDYDTLTDEDLVKMLVSIRDERADLALRASLYETELVQRRGRGNFTVDGIGEVAIKRKTKRTAWRHDEMVPAVIARVMDEPATVFDPETGELLPYMQIGHNITRRLRECISFGAGKVTGLRSIGLQPDEWCVEEVEGYSVQLPPREGL